MSNSQGTIMMLPTIMKVMFLTSLAAFGAVLCSSQELVYDVDHSEHFPEEQNHKDFSSNGENEPPPSGHCPIPCKCSLDTIDCSNKNLTTTPKLPIGVRHVYLRGNKIDQIPCSSFSSLHSIERLDLSENPLLTLTPCGLNITGPLRYLALSGCGIKTLPSEIFDTLTYLVELDLSRNEISELESSVFKSLRRLEHLNLFRNKLSNLGNDTFIHLSSLLFLSLQSNFLKYRQETFAPGAFRGLTSLETLHLHGNEHHEVDWHFYPDTALSSLPWLRTLRLDGYSNLPLGPGFAALINLTTLNFSPLPNQFEDAYCYMINPLGDDFFANINTTQPLFLSLSNCWIFRISEETFTHLPTLHNLDLSFNDKLGFQNFEVLSKGLQNTRISILNINRICKQLPQIDKFIIVYNTTFRYLLKTNLTVLSLEMNDIQFASSAAFYMLPKTLQHISVHNNFFMDGHFSTALLVLKNLKTFNASRQTHYNNVYYRSPNLEAVPYRFESLSTVSKEALVGGTQVSLRKKLGKGPYCSSKDKTLEADYCGSREVWNSPFPSKLESLDVSDIGYFGYLPRIQICNNTALKRFYYAKNYAKCISGPFQGFSNLEYLDLSKNFCFRLNPKAFEKLSNLKTLVLYDNLLGDPLANDTEGVIFSDLASLEILYLRNNAIKDLPDTIFSTNPNVRYLDLSDNALWRFAPSLENMLQLRVLDLSFNSLEGLSHRTCQQLQKIKSSNKDLIVYIRENLFICDCDNFNFLYFLVEHPQVFGDLEHFSCRSTNGDRLTYGDLDTFLPILAKKCVAPALFTPLLAVFLVVLAALLIFALYNYKRWQWTYLYYVGKSRLHIGSTLLTYKPVAQVFVTFDQDSLDCRRLVHTEFLPRLNDSGISHVVGEVDFEAGPLAPSIAGAVVSTEKTLVLFSAELFEDTYRAFEVNLAIMHELSMRKPVLVPVILLKRRYEADEAMEVELQPLRPFHRQLYYGDDNDDDDDDNDDDRDDNQERALLGGDQNNRNGQVVREHRGGGGNQEETLQDLLEDFPPEISAYLAGQIQRCIFYDGGSENFWNQLIVALVADG